MTDFTGIPRAFDVREAKRAREEEARRREQATSARNTSSATIGAGGRLDLDGGDLDIFNGGNTRVRDGGRFLIEGGGSMDITDDGQINVIGNGRSWPGSQLIRVVASLANRLAYNAWIGASYLVPGLYFTAEGESQGPYDPRVVSDGGVDVSAISAVKALPYGPQVGDNIVSKGSFRADSWNVSIGAFAWDNVLNPGGSDGVVGTRGSGSFSATPYDINMLLTNYTDGPDGIPSGPAVWVHGTLEDGKLELYGRNGVNVTGPFTVNGNGVATTALATPTADGLMPKADKAKLDNAAYAATPDTLAMRDGTGRIRFRLAYLDAAATSPDGIPRKDQMDAAVATRAPTSHTHTTAQVTGLDTALAGKASTAVATSTTDGLMSSADKSKLDGVLPLAYAPLSPAGWTAAGVLTKSKNSLGDAVNMDFNLTRTGGTLALTTAWTSIGAVIPPELFPPSGAAQNRYGFAFLAGFNVQIKMFINASNGQVSLSALTGTQNIPATNQVFIVTSWPYI